MSLLPLCNLLRSRAHLLALGAAVVFALAVIAIAWQRWWTFQYRTFDVAFYVQALWQLMRGRFDVSLLGVPLMGNHAEPIVFLIFPLFALVPSTMVFVVVQTLAIASMAPTAYDIGRRLGLHPRPALWLALAALAAPATGFFALHEFHPEAFSAPVLLLLFHARIAESRGRFWLWAAVLLGCKENMALLLLAYCAVEALVDRRRGIRHILMWYGIPAAAAVAWVLLYGRVLSPIWNPKHVEYTGSLLPSWRERRGDRGGVLHKSAERRGSPLESAHAGEYCLGNPASLSRPPIAQAEMVPRPQRPF